MLCETRGYEAAMCYGPSLKNTYSPRSISWYKGTIYKDIAKPKVKLEERLIEQLIVGTWLPEFQKELLAKDENLT